MNFKKVSSLPKLILNFFSIIICYFFLNQLSFYTSITFLKSNLILFYSSFYLHVLFIYLFLLLMIYTSIFSLVQRSTCLYDEIGRHARLKTLSYKGPGSSPGVGIILVINNIYYMFFLNFSSIWSLSFFFTLTYTILFFSLLIYLLPLSLSLSNLLSKVRNKNNFYIVSGPETSLFFMLPLLCILLNSIV